MNYYTLQPGELECLKIIRVQGEAPFRFQGHIYYLRKFYRGYNYETGDIFDSLFLGKIKKVYPNSALTTNMPLLLKTQLERMTQLYDGANRKPLLQHVWPHFEDITKAKNSGLIPQTITYDMRLMISPNNPAYETIGGFDAIDIDHNIFDDILQTIKFI